jgi:tRNA uridine 5-carboxymethylaminomethyl modification enzyme
MDWIVEHVGEPEHGLLGAIETHLKYAGYLRQEERQVARLLASEARAIPASLNYRSIPGLSREMVDKLERVRPVTLGQASRIPGVTPAAVSVLDIFLS